MKRISYRFTVVTAAMIAVPHQKLLANHHFITPVVRSNLIAAFKRHIRDHRSQSTRRQVLAIAVLGFVLSMGMTGVSANEGAYVKVAFVGDQGTNHNARAVLQMIADEGTELLLIQGGLRLQ